MKIFFKNNILTPITNLLKQGLTPEKIAMSLTAGLMISCFPILGTTTVLCAIVAQVFKFNHVAIQIANYAGYPLFFLLLIPFLYLGNTIFGYKNTVLNLDDLLMHFQIDPQGFFQTYLMMGLRGCVAWAICAPIGGFLIYFPLKFLTVRLSRKL
jgi:uncharacterized protein (DUF2062 family)